MLIIIITIILTLTIIIVIIIINFSQTSLKFSRRVAALFFISAGYFLHSKTAKMVISSKFQPFRKTLVKFLFKQCYQGALS